MIEPARSCQQESPRPKPPAGGFLMEGKHRQEAWRLHFKWSFPRTPQDANRETPKTAGRPSVPAGTFDPASELQFQLVSGGWKPSPSPRSVPDDRRTNDRPIRCDSDGHSVKYQAAVAAPEVAGTRKARLRAASV
jgi:hypothetical protein